jgi:tetratricopeptide (TPR) repeat protein
MADQDIYRAATAAIIAGEAARAEALLGGLLARNDRDARAMMLMSRVAALRRDFAGEWAFLARAVEADPGNGDYWAMWARSHARAQDMASALHCIDQALARGPLGEVALASVAATYSGFGRHAEAVDVLESAVARGSRNPAIHFSLGSNRKFTGDMAGARRALETAMELHPGYHKARAALVSLGAEGGAQDPEAIEAAIVAEPDARLRIHLVHAAAKALDAQGRHAEAWQRLEDGKAALRDAVRYDPAACLDRIDELSAKISQGRAPAFRAEAPHAGSPIFVVGMPRSGTTVLDRILSNHSRVTSMGESLYFAQQLKRAAGSRTALLLDQQVEEALDDERLLHEVGRLFGERCEAQVGAGVRPLDKFHLNFMLAGHIMRARPDARLLCLVRDPLDTIASNFRQLFEFETPLYHYALEQCAAARMQLAFLKLAQTWARLAPDQFRIISYEALVTDPEPQARALFAFCGLPWEEGCTRIEDNRASVATASAVQVRRPINRDTIGSWRRYAPQLGPAIALLREAGVGEDREPGA